MKIEDIKIKEKLVWWIGLFFYIITLAKRHTKLLRILLYLIIAYFATEFIWGSVVTDVVFVTIRLGFQLAFALLFMIGQFFGLFWFLSRTKVIETHPGDKGLISFKDYYGSEHLVALVKQWMTLLADRRQVTSMGGRSLSGILLIGPPGVGKTMLAQALSTESGSAFIGMTGSDFTSMFFGIGVLKVMAMFSKARKLAKQFGSCILFIDEVDAVATSRGAVQGDPRNGPVQGGMAGGMFGGMGGLGVLSRLLIEMDGLSEVSLWDSCETRARKTLGMTKPEKPVVLIMGATNRPDVLDPAITRPGRFDKKINVSLPDSRSRKLIIDGYLKKVSHEDSIDIDSLVSDTPWASPALLASSIQKDAVRLAIFSGRDKISQRDIEDALQENAFGFQQPISDLDDKQKWQISVHEASHAVAIHYLKSSQKIARVSIIRRSAALGYVMPVSKTDIYAEPLSEFTRDIMVAISGHVGTDVILGEPWTGASGDLSQMRNSIYYLALHGFFGSFPMGSDPLAWGETQKSVDRFISNCIEKVSLFIQTHKKEVCKLAEVLMIAEDLSGEEVVNIIKETSSNE